MPRVAPASLRRILSAGALRWWRSAGLDTARCCCEAMLTSSALRKKSATAPRADRPAEWCFIINCPWRCGYYIIAAHVLLSDEGGRLVRGVWSVTYFGAETAIMLFKTVCTCSMMTDNKWRRGGEGAPASWEVVLYLWISWLAIGRMFVIVVAIVGLGKKIVPLKSYKCRVPYKWHLYENMCCTRLRPDKRQIIYIPTF